MALQDTNKREFLALANRIRLCVEKFSTIADASAKMGISLSTLNNYLSGRNDVKVSMLVKMALAADVSIEWLATGKGEPDGNRPSLDELRGKVTMPEGAVMADDVENAALALKRYTDSAGVDLTPQQFADAMVILSQMPGDISDATIKRLLRI